MTVKQLTAWIGSAVAIMSGLGEAGQMMNAYLEKREKAATQAAIEQYQEQHKDTFIRIWQRLREDEDRLSKLEARRR